MRTVLHGYSVDLEIWDSLLAFCEMHPDLSIDDALDRLLKAALTKADKATVTVPIELFEALVECAHKLQRFAGMPLPVEVCIPVMQLADKAYQHAQEFTPTQPMQWEESA